MRIKVTIKYSTTSNEDRDKVASWVHSNLCGDPAYVESKIGINIDEDKLVYIWVDDLTEMETDKYVGLICTLISNMTGNHSWRLHFADDLYRACRVEVKNEENTPLS